MSNQTQTSNSSKTEIPPSRREQEEQQEREEKVEPAPDMIIQAPANYERTHRLLECPFCHSPNPILDMDMQVRELGHYFDACLYTCSGVCCECHFGSEYDPINGKTTIKPHHHKFSVKHEVLIDAECLKVFDRTHVKDIW
jgi:hypothetical protein